MTEDTIDLDQHRGMSAQKATELRRLLADVEANATALRLRQEELEAHLLAAPAANWREAAEKSRYLLNIFAATLAAQDPRRQKLIAAVLDDFKRGRTSRRDSRGSVSFRYQTIPKACIVDRCRIMHHCIPSKLSFIRRHLYLSLSD
jgi:hypothetical protein